MHLLIARGQPNELESHISAQLRREKRMHHAEPRSRVNEWAKFIVTQANFFLTLFGVVVFAGSIYTFFADFGDLDKGFFLGGGIMLFLFSIIVVMVAYLGGQGVYYQRKENKFTVWGGSVILSVYQFFLVATLAMQLIWVAVSMDAFTQLRKNADLVIAGNDVPMTSLEDKIAEKFNAFFFGAASACDSVAYQWFWSFVDKRCTKFNANMSQSTCQRCEDYSVTVCAADPKMCYVASYNLQAQACPYQACRMGVLEFVTDKFAPFSYFVIGMVTFQFLLISSNCALICYHKRDTDAEIKAKNGIFAQSKPQVVEEGGSHEMVQHHRAQPSHHSPEFQRQEEFRRQTGAGSQQAVQEYAYEPQQHARPQPQHAQQQHAQPQHARPQPQHAQQQLTPRPLQHAPRDRPPQQPHQMQHFAPRGPPRPPQQGQFNARGPPRPPQHR